MDKCETEKEFAWNVNAVGTRNVAEACAKIGAKLVYISTDYVFDGEKGLYSEEDETKPVNYYGLTKLRGEDYVRELCTDYVIARTSVIYGWHPRRLNFVTWVIDSVVKQKTISVVLDHYNSPTLADSLAEMVLHALDKGVGGVYHLTGGERISRYEFAIRVARTFHLDETLIMPVKMSDLNTWIAKRPRDSSLRIDKAEKEIDVSPMSLNVALERMKSSKDNAHTTLWIRGILEKDYEMGASTKILRKTAPRSSKSPSGLRAGA